MGVGFIYCPDYLTRRNDIWYFRIRVPQDLVVKIHRREVKVSLKTTNRRKAQTVALRLSFDAKGLFYQLREGRIMPNNLSMRLRELADRYFRELMQEADQARYARTTPLTDDDLAREEEHHRQALRDTTDHIRRYNWQVVYDTADELIARHSDLVQAGDVAKGSPEYHELCKRLHQADHKFHEQQLANSNPDMAAEMGVHGTIYDPAPARSGLVPPRMSTAKQGETPATADVPRLGQVVEAYFQHKNWKPSTLKSTTRFFGVFLDIVGRDKPIVCLDKATMRNYLEAINRLPVNQHIPKKLKGKPVTELLKREWPEDHRMSSKTRSQYLSYAQGFLNWGAKTYDHFPDGLAPVLDFKADSSKAKTYLPFDDADLKTIFHADEYSRDSFEQAPYFWIPILALFTGARQNELCQLYVDDLKQDESGAWFLDINDEGDDKLLKNLNSRRFIPLHPFLVDSLNFPGFVARVKAEGHERIWPDLNLYRGKYNHYFGRMFGSFINGLGFTSREKSFHSLRKTFANQCRLQNISSEHWEAVLGHINTKLPMADRYASKYPPAFLQEHVMGRLNFGVDLEHLTRSRWVVRD